MDIKQNDVNDTLPLYDQELSDAIANLKMICSCRKIPMFTILALQGENEETVYLRECIYASLSLSKQEKRISNLILSAKKGETHLPPHIERCIQDLTKYIENKQIIRRSRENLNTPLPSDQITKCSEIGDGSTEFHPPQEILNGGIRYDEDIDFLPDYKGNSKN